MHTHIHTYMVVICMEKRGGGDNWVIKIFGGGTSDILFPHTHTHCQMSPTPHQMTSMHTYIHSYTHSYIGLHTYLTGSQVQSRSIYKKNPKKQTTTTFVY